MEEASSAGGRASRRQARRLWSAQREVAGEELVQGMRSLKEKSVKSNVGNTTELLGAGTVVYAKAVMVTAFS